MIHMNCLLTRLSHWQGIFAIASKEHPDIFLTPPGPCAVCTVHPANLSRTPRIFETMPVLLDYYTLSFTSMHLYLLVHTSTWLYIPCYGTYHHILVCTKMTFQRFSCHDMHRQCHDRHLGCCWTSTGSLTPSAR